MAWVRRKPSGRWAATVYAPTGRIERTFDLKAQADAWAAEQEAQRARGDWIDPRLANVTVGAWWERCVDSRRLEAASRRRDDSQWRCHVEPKWGRVRMGVILKPDVSAWVTQMQRRGVGPSTIHGAVSVLRALLEQAVEARILRFNPARGVKLPRIPKHIDRLFDFDEEDLLLARLDELFPGRPDAGLFVRVLLGTGLRWEEAAALDRSAVDLRRRRLTVRDVMEADGTIRPYAKTVAGDGRMVPLDDDLTARLREHILTVPPNGLVFTSPEGDVLRYSNWLRRVWNRGLVIEVPADPASRPPGRPGPLPKARRHYLDDPQPTPHDCRHTFGSRLADAGVPEHEIAELMGHADRRSTQRYIHAGEARFERAREALARARNMAARKRTDRAV